MKFNSKQTENLARVLGSIASASTIGFGVGMARPETVTLLEKFALIVVCGAALSAMFLILKDPK